MTKEAADTPSALNPDEVRDFLKTNPHFLKENAELFAQLSAPERELGDGIIDFQHYMVKNLQKTGQDLKSRYDVLVDFCRDNMSVQHQVHQAALSLIRAKNIEQLLEVVTIDLVNLFNVDVVRLAMESEAAPLYDLKYNEENYSGIVFVGPGTVDTAIGKKKNVLLIGDCQNEPPFGFEQIFADCDEMTASCALLRLKLDKIGRDVMLAFGVRHKDRFNPGQGIELLNFLAQIVAHQLDIYLHDLTI